VRRAGRSSPLLLSRRFAGLLALLIATTVVRADDKKETRVVLDRTGCVLHGDPNGEGRMAIAIALALTGRPGGHVTVTAPYLTVPVEGEGTNLAGLVSVLRTIQGLPQLGGADMLPVFRAASESPGVVLAYTADEVDVVAANGKVPPEILEKVREKEPHPDRLLVNETARGLLVDAVGDKLKGRLVALKTALPAEARHFSFLDALGARTVELTDPIEAARTLVKEIGGPDLPAPLRFVLTDGKATVPCRPGSRVAVLGDGEIAPLSSRAVGIDPWKRSWIVDADAPFTIEGEAGMKVAALVAPRVEPEYRASAFRLASGAIQVLVDFKDRSIGLAARVQDRDLEKDQDGVWRGRFTSAEAAADATELKLEIGAGGALSEVAPVAIQRAVLMLAAAEEPLAGARTPLSIKTELPSDLLAQTIYLDLASGDAKVTVELTLKEHEYTGDAVLAEGTWSIASARAGDLPVELAAPLVSKKPAHLVATLVKKGPLEDGKLSLVCSVAVEPPLAQPAPLGVTASHGVARVVGGPLKDHGDFEVALEGGEPGPLELSFALPLARGAEARGTLALTIERTGAWKKPLALGLLGIGGLWLVIFYGRRSAIARRFGSRQLRGLGSNGKMSYERYFLRDHRDGPRSAVCPPGATAVHVEIGKDGRVRARALEGSELMGIDGGQADEVILVHETCFAVARGLYRRRWVYLDHEPTGDELLKKYVPGAPSYEGGTKDSDVIVLLDEQENMIPPSQRLTPVESAKLPRVSDVVKAHSDESIVVADSQLERVLEDSKEILDPGSSDETSSDDTVGEE
jgi:hypothetical protein